MPPPARRVRVAIPNDALFNREKTQVLNAAACRHCVIVPHHAFDDDQVRRLSDQNTAAPRRRIPIPNGHVAQFGFTRDDVQRSVQQFRINDRRAGFRALEFQVLHHIKVSGGSIVLILSRNTEIVGPCGQYNRIPADRVIFHNRRTQRANFRRFALALGVARFPVHFIQRAVHGKYKPMRRVLPPAAFSLQPRRRARTVLSCPRAAASTTPQT